ncbi:GTP 3',8-cyclase MoaA [Crenobacter sp. SG2303]|uniref:GTP 3',8-cyclase n=1 Tax=Crenobacter oryzisoli TaxID=3056844 RepID=A0ABT7XIC6_9NEIS|nr:GTP 3',8-cyclase MoaA [Crenobacter sp. SG2303]MDN0073540.1 GTP 3',8-cyclase MoaA [Crenobacter sp. SG2303]
MWLTKDEATYPHYVETLDSLQRPLKDLRLSVIDKCNFRCSYCMPKDVFTKDYPFLKHSQLMSFDEMLKLARGFVALGAEKIRITGGEPLLRKNIEHLIESLARLTTPSGKPVSISMTTNGTLLASKAQALKDAGLERVTVSLDSLDNDIFMRMNDVGVPVSVVLKGIEAAQRAGLSPVKVNTVVQKGVNDSQIMPIVNHFRHSGVTVRFIEYMDVGGANYWSNSGVMTSDLVRARIEQEHRLIAVAQERASDTAHCYRYADGAAGEVGFISSVSEPFCGDCTRARVSADGKLFMCLFATESLDLRPLLGENTAPEVLADTIRAAWRKRGDHYSELRDERYKDPAKKVYPTVRMSLVGG